MSDDDNNNNNNKLDSQCFFCAQPHTNTIMAYEDDTGEPLWVLSVCATHLIWLGDAIYEERERRMHPFDH